MRSKEAKICRDDDPTKTTSYTSRFMANFDPLIFCFMSREVVLVLVVGELDWSSYPSQLAE